MTPGRMIRRAEGDLDRASLPVPPPPACPRHVRTCLPVRRPRSKVKGSVVVLTELNFDELVSASEEPWMLDIFAPW